MHGITLYGKNEAGRALANFYTHACLRFTSIEFYLTARSPFERTRARALFFKASEHRISSRMCENGSYRKLRVSARSSANLSRRSPSHAHCVNGIGTRYFDPRSFAQAPTSHAFFARNRASRKRGRKCIVDSGYASSLPELMCKLRNCAIARAFMHRAHASSFPAWTFKLHAFARNGSFGNSDTGELRLIS